MRQKLLEDARSFKQNGGGQEYHHRFMGWGDCRVTVCSPTRQVEQNWRLNILGYISVPFQGIHYQLLYQQDHNHYKQQDTNHTRQILWSWSCSCGRQTVDQLVWVSGLPLGTLTRFYLALLSLSDNYLILLSKASSLTRKWVCSLQCNHSLVRLLTNNNHTLSSHLRLCSLFVASYDSRGLRWRYSNPPPHGLQRLNFS
jgi:hypothetical protein